ncbi:Cytochrome P450 4d2 [Kappamyces sp. JEL0680]|nr:Cytochrome P450 4d2 [Kappamyces sp. JEL0680]
MMNVTLDILGTIVFGKEFGAVAGLQEHRESIWNRLSAATFRPVAMRTAMPSFLWSWCGLHSSSPAIEAARTEIRAYCRNMIKGSMEKIRSCEASELDPAALNLLERFMVSQVRGDLTEEEVFGETIGLFLAGHESSSNTIIWILFELAKHPDLQTRLYAEVKDVDLADAGLSESIQTLSFLDHVMKEAQRLHSIVGGIFRETKREVQVMGYTLPKGTKIVASLRAIHRDPRHYPDPTKYNPDRWTTDINPNAFMPFGAGPHMCLGRRVG